MKKEINLLDGLKNDGDYITYLIQRPYTSKNPQPKYEITYRVWRSYVFQYMYDVEFAAFNTIDKAKTNLIHNYGYVRGSELTVIKTNLK